MNALRITFPSKIIKIEVNDEDAIDIIEAIEMAENEGIVNRASTLKEMLKTALGK